MIRDMEQKRNFKGAQCFFCWGPLTLIVITDWGGLYIDWIIGSSAGKLLGRRSYYCETLMFSTWTPLVTFIEQ